MNNSQLQTAKKLTFASDISSQVIKIDMSPSAWAIIHNSYKTRPANIGTHVPSLASHGFCATSCDRKKKGIVISFIKNDGKSGP